MIKLTQNWFTRGQLWASVSKREQCLCRTSKRTSETSKRTSETSKRTSETPKRTSETSTKREQAWASVSKREQCILMSQPIVWFFELLITRYTCCWRFLALLKFTRLDIPRLSRRSTFSGPLGWDLAFWGLWTFRELINDMMNQLINNNDNNNLIMIDYHWMIWLSVIILWGYHWGPFFQRLRLFTSS